MVAEQLLLTRDVDAAVGVGGDDVVDGDVVQVAYGRDQVGGDAGGVRVGVGVAGMGCGAPVVRAVIGGPGR